MGVACESTPLCTRAILHCPLWQDPCQRQQNHLLGSMQFERPCAFVERGAGGHHVIDQDDPFPRQVGRAMERAADILLAFAPRQAGLRRCVPDARTAVRLDRQFQGGPDRAREFEGLVEAPLAQAFWMQWQGNDQIGGDSGGLLRQKLPKIRRQRQTVRVFERLYQPVEREIVAEDGLRDVVMRRVRQAAAAERFFRDGQGAARAGRLRKPRQGFDAGTAEQRYAARLPAEQAVLRQQGVDGMPGDELCAG